MPPTAADFESVHLFDGVPARHLRRIEKLVEERDIPKGDPLVREGRYTREFFLIFSGEAAVTVRGRKRDVLGRGNFFGELAILNKTARTATVTALTPMRVGVIDAGDFQKLLEEEPKIALHLLAALARRLEWLTTRPAGKLD
jgi:voltage-gated potassium channel